MKSRRRREEEKDGNKIRDSDRSLLQISGFVDGGRGIQGGSLLFLLDDAVSIGYLGKGGQGCDAYGA